VPHNLPGITTHYNRTSYIFYYIILANFNINDIIMLYMRDRNPAQPELFDEFKKPKRAIDRLREKYVPHKRFFVTISIENLVLISISVIMVVVLFFSLGVERGKRIKVISPVVITERPKEIVEKPKITTPAEEITKISEKKNLTAYTVQVMTIRNEAAADKEINALKKKGHSAFIIPSGEFYQVCIGRYETLEEAKKAKQQLRSRYKDCFEKRTDTN